MNLKYKLRKSTYNQEKRRRMHQVLSRLNQDDIANVYGVKYVAGIDECGNGAACGPITAAVCVFKVDTVLPINCLLYTSDAADE